MPTTGKGKRKVTAGPMNPQKTREPVTGHPDGGYESDTSMVTDDDLLTEVLAHMLPVLGRKYQSAKRDETHKAT